MGKFSNNWKRRNGNFLGFRSIIDIVCALEILGVVLFLVAPQFVMNYLILNPAAILHGQIWRIVTFLVYPPAITGSDAIMFVLMNALGIYCIRVRRVRAPSVFIELAFHDNLEDANWIIDNLGAIARNIVLSLTEYFQIPFFESENRHPGVVDVTYGYLNIRSRPTTQAPVIAQAPDGAPITIINQWDGWYLVNYQGSIGYAKDDFVTLN